MKLDLTMLNATTMQPVSDADNPRPQEGLFSGEAGRYFDPTVILTDTSSHTFKCKVLLLSSDIDGALVKIKVSGPGLCVVTRAFRSRARSNKSDTTSRAISARVRCRATRRSTRTSTLTTSRTSPRLTTRTSTLTTSRTTPRLTTPACHRPQRLLELLGRGCDARSAAGRVPCGGVVPGRRRHGRRGPLRRGVDGGHRGVQSLGSDGGTRARGGGGARSRDLASVTGRPPLRHDKRPLHLAIFILGLRDDHCCVSVVFVRCMPCRMLVGCALRAGLAV